MQVYELAAQLTVPSFVHACTASSMTVPSSSAVLYNDLYRYDPKNVTWTALTALGSAPSPRESMGFTATPDGMLYLFGGQSGIEASVCSPSDTLVWAHVCTRTRLFFVSCLPATDIPCIAFMCGCVLCV